MLIDLLYGRIAPEIYSSIDTDGGGLTKMI